MSVAELLSDVLGDDVPVALLAYDGSRFGPPDARTTIVVRSPDALRRIVTAPDELGFGRAYVAGELEVDGDIFDVMAVANHIEELDLGPRQIAAAAKLVGWKGLKPLPPPPEEARLHGRRHSRERDAAAIAHHYDVSNEFYEMVLGPSLTYSCAVWHDDTTTLEDAQANKHELVCRKLGLEPGMRLLDVGCGWGGMLLHAAEHHGVEAVGVTLSRPQAELARQARRRARARPNGSRSATPTSATSTTARTTRSARSACSSTSGCRSSTRTSRGAAALLRPEGRLLNHGISRPHALGARSTTVAGRRDSWAATSPSATCSPTASCTRSATSSPRSSAPGSRRATWRACASTTRSRCAAGCATSRRNWDAAVAEVGAGRARVWRLYMAAAAVGFEHDDNQVHQVLATATTDGASGMPLRPGFT